MKIRNKLIIVLLMFSIIPVTTLLIFEIKRDQETLEKQIGVSSLEFTRLAMMRINEYLYFKYVDVQKWVNNINQEGISAGDDDASISNYLKKLVESYDEYHYIICLNKEGRIVASSDVELMNMDIEPGMEIQKLLNGKLIIQDVSFNKMAGGYAVVISVPIRDTDEQTRIVGVISAALRWNKVNKMIASLEIKGKKQDLANHFMLTNEDGLVISCFDNKQMFATNLISIGLKSAKNAQEHKEGSIVETSEHGLSSFSTYTYMKKYNEMPLVNWRLILYQDSERVFEPVYSLEKPILYILPTTIVFLIIISYYLANRISKPILSLALMAQDIGKGDLSKKINVNSKDEIAYLADSFNKMRVALSRSFTNIERHKKELQQLSKRIVIVQEEERKNLSRELHDDAGQALTAMKINVEMMEKEIPDSNVSVRRRLADTKQLLSHTLQEIRTLAFELRPSLLDDFGVQSAIKEYTKGYSERTKIDVQVLGKKIVKRFPSEIDILLYRCVQEALNNVVKHSKATKVTIEIIADKEEIHMRVKDNGYGFDVKEVLEENKKSTSIGLFGMKERVALLNGSLKIYSERKKGTELAILIPFKTNKENSVFEGGRDV
ncbi:integral membrane sensor signal transduction histidine kinase [Candidatus Scalindua japonica]|uniref:histidine kinase n=1 Tax=Candidatus Scalindua japonica TaxID=1284222 RepID=A0A286TWR8_9BACT|nr:histidine kinase [Candidatus Scalindua japonica]GAX60328.1 integral membrane sensor signal transduction histidine kinase [Candidatus Scalindua japonica]